MLKPSCVAHFGGDLRAFYAKRWRWKRNILSDGFSILRALILERRQRCEMVRETIASTPRPYRRISTMTSMS
jgi:hypothetical protein